MSYALRKMNGDVWFDPETGRSEAVTGPNKVDQELADLYLSTYDPERNWGSEFALKNFITSGSHTKALLFLKLVQANARITAKQSSDVYLDATERITEFSRVVVDVEPTTQAPIFYSVADLMDVSVTKLVVKEYKPTSLKHVKSPLDVL